MTKCELNRCSHRGQQSSRRSSSIRSSHLVLVHPSRVAVSRSMLHSRLHPRRTYRPVDGKGSCSERGGACPRLNIRCRARPLQGSFVPIRSGAHRLAIFGFGAGVSSDGRGARDPRPPVFFASRDCRRPRRPHSSAANRTRAFLAYIVAELVGAPQVRT
jgi:hypothetical protein